MCLLFFGLFCCGIACFPFLGLPCLCLSCSRRFSDLLHMCKNVSVCACVLCLALLSVFVLVMLLDVFAVAAMLCHF